MNPELKSLPCCSRQGLVIFPSAHSLLLFLLPFFCDRTTSSPTTAFHSSPKFLEHRTPAADLLHKSTLVVSTKPKA
jgi:hypothetical protein